MWQTVHMHARCFPLIGSISMRKKMCTFSTSAPHICLPYMNIYKSNKIFNSISTKQGQHAT